jgi:hypothetical protein
MDPRPATGVGAIATPREYVPTPSWRAIPNGNKIDNVTALEWVFSTELVAGVEIEVGLLLGGAMQTLRLVLGERPRW